MEIRTTTATRSLERRVLTGTGLQLAARALTAVATACAFVLLGRHLDDRELGVFHYHFTLFLILGALVDFGSFAIAVRESIRRPEREADLIRAVTRLRLAYAGVCFVVYAALAWWDVREPRRFALLMIAALHLFATAPGATAAWLQTRVRLTAIALAPIAAFGLYLGTTALLCARGVREPAAFVVAFGAALAVQSLIPWAVARRHVQAAPSSSPAERETLARQLFGMMLPLGISAAISTLYFRMDALLLRQFVGPEANGVYARAFPLLSLAIALPNALSLALLPAMTRAAARGSGDLLALVRRVCAVLAGFALPGALIGTAFGAQVLWLLWAPSSDGARPPLATWAAAHGDLVRCVPPLAVAGFAIFLTYPQMHALTALGRQAVLARVSIEALVLKFVVSIAVIRQFGVPGAALGTAFAEIFVLARVSFHLGGAAGGFATSLSLLRPAAVALAAGVAAFLLRHLEPVPGVLCACVLLVAAAFAAGALPLKLGIDE